MPPPSRPELAPALVVGASLSTQLASALATHLFTLVGPPGAVALRLAGATSVMLVAARPRAMRAAWARAPRAIIALGLASASMNLAFYGAIDRIPLGTAVTIEFLGPVTVSVATGRRRADLLWAVLALGGVALAAGGLGGHVDALGAGFALLAGVGFGTYLLTARRMGGTGTGTGGLAAALAVGAAAAGPLLLIAHPAAADVPQALVLGLAVGTFSNALAYALEIAALRRASLTTVGVLLALEPAIAALVGLVALGQGLAPAQVAGVALVVVAGWGAVRAARPRVEPSSARSRFRSPGQGTSRSPGRPPR